MLPMLAVLASLAVTGCAPSASVTQPTGASAAARGADTPLEPIDAFALCKAQTLSQASPASLSGISWAPFENAVTLVRDDGAIGIYIEATNENRAEGSDGRDIALFCRVGGTIGEPDWLGFGVGSRETDRDYILDILSRTDQA
ncbi:hypothetical protein C3B59_11325 [Cryobacterium zongtaii]|uniref:Uncharacterized protein n=2 Tax=Cryobacterium zongtaii TaxID=1259217 RepID=A0A2S3ZB69_9MICO|nr:hypothetical protein C3B59_11325 [Cryobacterium zongtaii]